MGRVLGLDVGARRTGVAVSDPLRITARPLTVLEGDELAVIAAQVRTLVADHGAELIVVGLPLLPSGDHGDQARDVLEFVRLLEGSTVPIVLWDESYSTVEVGERRRDRRAKSDRDTPTDAEAAAIILESWMAAQPSKLDASAARSVRSE